MVWRDLVIGLRYDVINLFIEAGQTLVQHQLYTSDERVFRLNILSAPLKIVSSCEDPYIDAARANITARNLPS